MNFLDVKYTVYYLFYNRLQGTRHLEKEANYIQRRLLKTFLYWPIGSEFLPELQQIPNIAVDSETF